jgi:hypothetical protein
LKLLPENTGRPAVRGDVVFYEHENVFLLAQPQQQCAQYAIFREIERSADSFVDQAVGFGVAQFVI